MHYQAQLFLASTVTQSHIDSLARYIQDQAEYFGLGMDMPEVEAEKIGYSRILLSFLASIMGAKLSSMIGLNPSRDYTVTVTAYPIQDDSGTTPGSLERLVNSALNNALFRKDIRLRESPLYAGQGQPPHTYIRNNQAACADNVVL
ncbi:hypothetical protein HYY72_03475 [Candidatus Woesearchaeota archaeon]|nr:hypothetical protein [Candidatus Woesearchaeota archaeon]